MTTTTSNSCKSSEVTPQVQRSTYVRPLANISETAAGCVVEAELPGVSEAGLEVPVETAVAALRRRFQPAYATLRPILRPARITAPAATSSAAPGSGTTR